MGQCGEGEAESKGEGGEDGGGGGGGVAEAVAAEALLGVAVVSALGHPRGGRVRGAGERQLGAVPQPGNAEGGQSRLVENMTKLLWIFGYVILNLILLAKKLLLLVSPCVIIGNVY